MKQAENENKCSEIDPNYVPQTTESHIGRANRALAPRPMNDTQVQLVESIRGKLASVWADLDAIGEFSASTETKRLIAIAKTDIEGATMWLTKAISRR